MTLRRTVELKTGPSLVMAGRLPKLVPFVVVLGLLIVGLLLQSAVGGALLLVLAALLGLLLYLAWPALQARPRALRLAVLGMLIASAGERIF